VESCGLLDAQEKTGRVPDRGSGSALIPAELNPALHRGTSPSHKPRPCGPIQALEEITSDDTTTGRFGVLSFCPNNKMKQVYFP